MVENFKSLNIFSFLFSYLTISYVSAETQGSVFP